MTIPRAAIDIGTHTARLLIASDLEASSGTLRPLVRKRAYIRLAEDFDYLGKRAIQPGAIHRTISVLQEFLNDISMFNVDSVHAIATGVIRDATNQEEFLDRIRYTTGIHVNLISGDSEARLTAKGVRYGLGAQKSPYLIFDLGGGSTEFFIEGKDTDIVKSAPLGAMTLTKVYLKSEPPEEKQVESLSEYIDRCLKEYIPEFVGTKKPFFVVGTGGTVTTLALVLHQIAFEDISAETVNGLVLKRQAIITLFNKMMRMRFEERLKLPGLDSGRAGIILAGSLLVIRILFFLQAHQLTVSLSDLLEGILINHSKGESNG